MQQSKEKNATTIIHFYIVILIPKSAIKRERI